MTRRLFPLATIITCSVLALAGCSGNKQAAAEDPAQCKMVKEGTITTVNKMCAVENEDPVNPKIMPVVWKGQKVGFCCDGCKPRWAKMTDAEKDKALAVAIEKSK